MGKPAVETMDFFRPATEAIVGGESWRTSVDVTSKGQWWEYNSMYPTATVWWPNTPNKLRYHSFLFRLCHFWPSHCSTWCTYIDSNSYLLFFIVLYWVLISLQLLAQFYYFPVAAKNICHLSCANPQSDLIPAQNLTHHPSNSKISIISSRSGRLDPSFRTLKSPTEWLSSSSPATLVADSTCGILPFSFLV